MRKAIAMIELIFAMVIIAITLLSVPNLISKTTQASKNAITQEAISNAAAQLDIALTSFWDENATVPQAGNPILVVDSNISGLQEQNITVNLKNGAKFIKVGKRAGSPKDTSRVYAIDTNTPNGARYTATPVNALGFDANDNNITDDVDDFNNRNTTISLEAAGQKATATNGDYKDTTIRMHTDVAYIDERPTPTTAGGTQDFNNSAVSYNNPFTIGNPNQNKTTNIKLITLTLTSQDDPNKRVILRAFSCNIGSAQIKERVF